MSQAASNVDVLANPENVKIMSNILKTNVSACTSIGSFFLPQLGRIWLDMLGLYKAVSGIISEQVATQGKLRSHRPRDIADIQDWSLPRHQKSVHFVRSRRRS
jgi:exportin-1